MGYNGIPKKFTKVIEEMSHPSRDTMVIIGPVN